MSTIPDILIADPREFEAEREQLKEKIIAFQKNGPERCTTHPHAFFGKLTPEQWGGIIQASGPSLETVWCLRLRKPVQY